jgi:hypothetical protein
MFMRKICLFSLFVISLLNCWAAQAPSSKPTSNLEFRLQAEDLQYGLPQTFTFLLVNVSDHDVRVPVIPIVDCKSPLYGGIELRLKSPVGQGISRGCPVDPLRGQSIQDRVKVWKLLHPGESMSWRAGKERALYNDETTGAYEFWGHYDPPEISPSDQAWLGLAGIDYPDNALDSAHIKFVKKP